MHVLLIAALCFSQLAAHVHMASHFSTEVGAMSVESGHPPGQGSLSHHPALSHSSHIHAEHDDSDNFDCSIYHAYLGHVACSIASNTSVDTFNRASVALPITVLPVNTPAIQQHPIRGPPLYY